MRGCMRYESMRECMRYDNHQHYCALSWIIQCTFNYHNTKSTILWILFSMHSQYGWRGTLVVEYVNICMRTDSTLYFDDIRGVTYTDRRLSTKMQKVIHSKRCLMTSIQMIKIFNIIHLGGGVYNIFSRFQIFMGFFYWYLCLLVTTAKPNCILTIITTFIISFRSL